MSRIVAGTELQTKDALSGTNLRSNELQSKASSPLDLSKQNRLDEGDAQGCFHVRHVEVNELLEDNTLGLLLHGTSVVGFCSSRAEQAGWRVGDQIVEVNGQRVGSFDEFLDCFVRCQAETGLPIDFSVLRREQRQNSETDEAEDALENFFNATNFVDLAGQLQKKFGSSWDRNGNAGDEDYGQILRSESMSILENPYIQALKRRRDELLLSTEGWTGAVGTPPSASIASRLATRKDAGLATLDLDADERPLKPCGWPLCSASRGGACREAPMIGEVTQTPRPDQFDAAFDPVGCSAIGRSSSSRQLNEASSAWKVFDGSEGAAFLSTPCVDSGLLNNAGYDAAGGGAEKENSRQQEPRSDNRLDGPTSDDIKNSGAPDRTQPSPESSASRNFASRLVAR